MPAWPPGAHTEALRLDRMATFLWRRVQESNLPDPKVSSR